MKLLITLAALVTVVIAKPGYSSFNNYGGNGAGYGGYHGPAAPLAHDGRVIETPEVAHAKAAHLAAHAEAAAKASWGGPAEEQHSYGYSGYGGGAQAHGYAVPTGFSNNVAHAGHGYHGPPAPLDHEGRVIDTPDVAHLKAAHLAAHAEAAAKAHYNGGYELDGYSGGHGLGNGLGHGLGHGLGYGLGHGSGHGYHGPAAPLAHDGRVVDTPEVAHAKAAHLAAHSAASSAHGHGYYNGYAQAPAYKW